MSARKTNAVEMAHRNAAAASDAAQAQRRRQMEADAKRIAAARQRQAQQVADIEIVNGVRLPSGLNEKQKMLLMAMASDVDFSLTPAKSTAQAPVSNSQLPVVPPTAKVDYRA